MAIEDALKRSEVFLGLDDNDLKTIASLPSSREDSYEAGYVLFRAGEEAKHIYIVEEGQIAIIVEVPASPGHMANQITVDMVNKGNLIGWSALVRPHLYVLSALCRKPCKVALMSGRELLTLFEQDHSIGYKIFQGLSQVIGTRYRDLQQILINGKRWPFIEKHFGT